jgi:hypothetical protein
MAENPISHCEQRRTQRAGHGSGVIDVVVGDRSIERAAAEALRATNGMRTADRTLGQPLPLVELMLLKPTLVFERILKIWLTDW